MRVVIESSNDSNSTLEDVSSIDDLNTTVNNDFSKNPLPKENGCYSLEEPADDETQNPVPDKDTSMETIDKMVVKLGEFYVINDVINVLRHTFLLVN